MEVWTLWLIIAVVLMAVELSTTGIVFLYPSLGAVAAMVASLLGYGWDVTLPLFGATAILLYLATHRIRKRVLSSWHSGRCDSTTGMDALVGRTGNLTGGSDLRLRIDGDSWRVRPENASVVLSEGDKVRVTGFDSIVLTVEKTD